MRPLSYGMLFFFWGCAQAIAMSALLWTLFPGLAWIPWAGLCAVAVLVGLTFSHRRGGPAGKGAGWMMGAFLAVGLLAMLTRGASAFPFLGIMLLLGRNFTLSARRDLYFNLAVCVVLFTEPLSSPPGAMLWMFGLLFLVALVGVLVADYADQRIARALPADALRVPRELMTAGNLALVSLAILAFGFLIFLLLPQPRPFDMRAWRDLRSTYTHIAPDPGRGHPGGSAATGGAAGQSGGQGRAGNAQGSGTAGSGGAAGGAEKLFEVVADRKLYLRTGTRVRYEAGQWHPPEAAATRLKGTYRFTLPGGEKDERVPYGIEILSELPATIPTAIRPQFLRTDTQAVWAGPDHTIALDEALRPGRIIYAESAMSYRGKRPASDVTAVGDFEGLRALPASGEGELVEQARRLGLGRASALRRAEAIEERLRSDFRIDREDGSEDPLALLSKRSGPPRAFAPAMTLLLRADGIPARVVEGYRVRRFDPLSQRYFVVKRDEHIWVEAYLESRWVAFEPLPGAPLPGPDSAQSLFETFKDRLEIWLEDLRDERAELKDGAWWQRAWLAIVEALVVLLLALLRHAPWVLVAAAAAYVLMRRLGKSFARLADWLDRYRLWRHRADEPARRVMLAHELSERACRRRGAPRLHTENHVEYASSAARRFPHIQTPLSLLGKLFGEARYGRQRISVASADHACGAYLDVLRYIDLKIPARSN